MRSPTTLSAEFLYQSQFSRTVELGWVFTGILTVRFLRLVFPVCNITLTSCSMIGRANPFGLKQWDKQSAAREKVNTWFLCPSNIQHGQTVETASADKSFLPCHRSHTRLWALSLQWLWLKWGHLIYAFLPKLSVPPKRARDWNRKQWKLQSLSFCRIIPKKSPHWKTCWWASKLFRNLTLKHETVIYTMPKGKSSEYQCFLVCLVRFSSGNTNFTQQ